eukprot:scaffold912_cov48-Phaeocystis_antarctica.AAC.1
MSRPMSARGRACRVPSSVGSEPARDSILVPGAAGQRRQQRSRCRRRTPLQALQALQALQRTAQRVLAPPAGSSHREPCY